jgi:hypothetical protein
MSPATEQRMSNDIQHLKERMDLMYQAMQAMIQAHRDTVQLFSTQIEHLKNGTEP